MKSGIEYMMWLADWYKKIVQEKELVSSKLVELQVRLPPICVVPMLYQDMKCMMCHFGLFLGFLTQQLVMVRTLELFPNEKLLGVN